MIQSLLLSIALLATPNIDPIDHDLAAETFEKSFVVGDKITITTTSCFGGICDKPYNTEIAVTSVTPDSAVVEGRRSDGTPVSRANVTKADWTALKFNRIRFELRALEGAGFKVDVVEVKTSFFKLSINGSEVTVPTFIVSLAAKSAAGLNIRETLEVGANVGGVAQLLRREVEKFGGKDTFIVAAINKSARRFVTSRGTSLCLVVPVPLASRITPGLKAALPTWHTTSLCTVR